MFCTQCGKPSPDNSRFCKHCGFRFNAEPEAQSYDERPLKVEVAHGPVFTVAIVTLEQGQLLRAEAGAMVSMDPGVHLEAKSEGGIWVDSNAWPHRKVSRSPPSVRPTVQGR